MDREQPETPRSAIAIEWRSDTETALSAGFLANRCVRDRLWSLIACDLQLRPVVNYKGPNGIAIGPAHTGSPGPFGPGTPEESEKSTPGQGPKSAERVRPGVSKESEKSLKPDFRTLFGLFWDSGAHSFSTVGALPRGTLSLKTLTSLNKEVRPFFLSDNSIWSLPSVSSLSDYSIWSSWRLFYPCDHSIWSIWVHCPQILLSLRKKGNEGVWTPYLRRLRSSRFRTLFGLFRRARETLSGAGPIATMELDSVSEFIKFQGQKWSNALEDRNLLKLRNLDSSCPFFLSDNTIREQWTRMLQMLWSQD